MHGTDHVRGMFHYGCTPRVLPVCLQDRAFTGDRAMARYSRSASKDVERAMHKRKQGTLKRGKHGHGGKVKSRKQAIAIGLSEARKKGKKVPSKSKSKSGSKRKSKRKTKHKSKS